MLELALFGPPRVRRDDADVRFDTRKAIAVLGLLAETGRLISRDAIAAMLWPDLDHVHARAALRRTLSSAGAVGPALRIADGHVGLDLARVSCDVREFGELAASDDPDDLARAVDLARGEFLEGLTLRDSPAFDDWRQSVADRLRDQVSGCLARLVATEVDRGDLVAALGRARARVDADPMSEPAHVDLIRVIALTGDRPGALNAYRALVRRLDRELGVPPLPATRALHDAIRTGTVGSALPAVPRAKQTAPPLPAREARFVGRQAERARLEGWWRGEEASPVQGVVGERGVGKSTLADGVARRAAADGAVVMRVAGRVVERTLPYAAVDDLIRAAVAARPGLPGELGEAAGPLTALTSALGPGMVGSIDTPGDLRRLYDAAREAMAVIGSAGPALIVVDDAHLVDRPSARLLAYLARRVPAGIRMLVIWPQGMGDAPLPESVAAVGGILTIPPFGREDVAELVGEAAADDALRRSRGIPLLVREIAQAGPDALADDRADVRVLVAARFDGAPAITRQLVSAVATIGTVADPDLLRVACGRDESETVDAIEDGLARGLLVEHTDPAGYEVPHEVVREIATAGLSLARARLLHGRIADALARRHAVDPLRVRAASIAQHLADAGREHESGAWYLIAAEESTRVAAHGEAQIQLRAALALHQDPEETHRLIGESLVKSGQYQQALVALGQAAALTEDDRAGAARIDYAIGGVHARRGEWPLAVAYFESAAEAAESSDPRTHRRILADLALAHHRLGAADDAVRIASRAVNLAADAGDDAAGSRADNVLAMIALAQGRAVEAEAILAAAVAGARRASDDEVLAAILNNLSRAREGTDPAGARAAAEEALTVAERHGDLHRIAALHSRTADLLHAAGDEDASNAHLRRSAAAFAAIEGSEATPEVWMLTAW